MSWIRKCDYGDSSKKGRFDSIIDQKKLIKIAKPYQDTEGAQVDFECG
jgi:hypothetical protein